MSFFQRVFSYVFNEALVNGLANNRIFQRFAIKSNELFNDLSKKGTQSSCATQADWRVCVLDRRPTLVQV